MSLILKLNLAAETEKFSHSSWIHGFPETVYLQEFSEIVQTTFKESFF